LEQFWKAVTAFHYTPDPTFWYYPEAPLVDFVLGALMLVGIVATCLRWRWPSRGLTLLWFWSTLVMAWFLTENPPSSQRGLLLMPAVALLVAWGVDGMWTVLRSTHRHFAQDKTVTQAFQPAEGVAQTSPPAGQALLPYLWRGVALMLLALFIILNTTFYFAIYTPRRVYGNPTAQIATEFVRFNATNPLPGATVYFFGPPFLYWDFGTLAFLLRDQPGIDVPPDAFVDALPEYEDVVAPARFVVVNSRLEALPQIKRAYPGGTAFEIRTADGSVLAVVYDWLGP